MQKDDLVFVGHMPDLARKALELSQQKTREDFDSDEALALALTHLLQVIGEAARKTSKSFTDRHPEIPWKAIIGMRHKVVHDYLYVDRDVVWDVVKATLRRWSPVSLCS